MPVTSSTTADALWGKIQKKVESTTKGVARHGICANYFPDALASLGADVGEMLVLPSGQLAMTRRQAGESADLLPGVLDIAWWVSLRGPVKGRLVGVISRDVFDEWFSEHLG